MFDATEMHGPPEPIAAASRRSFLKAAAATAGTLLIGFRLSAATAADATSEVFAPDAFIRIFPTGKITLIMPQVEMGQGIYTAVAMILAEELDAAFDQITLEAAPPNDALYANQPSESAASAGTAHSARYVSPCALARSAARATSTNPSTDSGGITAQRRARSRASTPTFSARGTDTTTPCTSDRISFGLASPGAGFNSAELIQLKMVVFAPMPSASIRMAMTANPGARSIIRRL